MNVQTFVFVVLIAHPTISLFFHSVFLHRYATHKQFSMNLFVERIFFVLTFIVQGPAFLNPYAYAVFHLNHHKYSDTSLDSHSPLNFKNIFLMMWDTKKQFVQIREGKHRLCEEYASIKHVRWLSFEKFADNILTILFMGGLFVSFYYFFAPVWWCWFFLPITLLNGPIQGAIVNWFGHKTGYRNFATPDSSKNVYQPIGWFMLGETNQNNHHKFPNSPNFGKRWFEIDLAYMILIVLHMCRIIVLHKKPL